MEEGPKRTLKRRITPEMLESRKQDTETILDNYRENLRSHGVTDEQAIERFCSQERAKMEREYEHLDRGDPSGYIYQMPQDWKGVADGMKTTEQEEEEEDEISM